MNSRDDFTRKTKDILAKRVGYICSNPNCMRMTVGPKQGETDSALSLGQAAHITAASVGGPRYDGTLTPQERKSINNGLWLCYSCATLIDRDEFYYTKELLHSWKESAEKKASDAITKPLLSQIGNDSEPVPYINQGLSVMPLSLDNKIFEFKELMKFDNPVFSLEGPENYDSSYGFLMLDDIKRPYEEIEVRKFYLFGCERYDILGRYFQVIISINNGIQDGFLFAFDLNFSDVKRRLAGFENILPILKSEKLTFSLPNKNNFFVLTSTLPEWKNQLNKSLRNIDLMEAIIKIQDYYDIEFSLPYIIESELSSKIDIIYKSILGEECIKLNGFPNELFDDSDMEMVNIEKTLLTSEVKLSDDIEVLEYRFIPKEYYILSGRLELNLDTSLWEINNEGIPITCSFKCEPMLG